MDQILRSKTRTHALLERAAAGADDDAGVRCVLEVIALLTAPACTWRNGLVHVEFGDGGESTFVDVWNEKDGGRERALPTIVIPLRLEEVRRIIRTSPKALAPLGPTERDGKLCLRSDTPVHTKPTVRLLR